MQRHAQTTAPVAWDFLPERLERNQDGEEDQPKKDHQRLPVTLYRRLLLMLVRTHLNIPFGLEKPEKRKWSGRLDSN